MLLNVRLSKEPRFAKGCKCCYTKDHYQA